jgi:hypothetical protein
VIAEVRERLPVSLQAGYGLDVDRFHLMKLNELEVREQYNKKFSSLDNVNDNEVINGVWEDVRENIKTSAIKGLGR